MTAELTIEKFDNGIALTWNSLSDESLPAERKVAKETEEFEAIGEQIWADVENIFDKEQAEKIYLKIEYSKLY